MGFSGEAFGSGVQGQGFRIEFGVGESEGLLRYLIEVVVCVKCVFWFKACGVCVCVLGYRVLSLGSRN